MPNIASAAATSANSPLSSPPPDPPLLPLPQNPRRIVAARRS
jgi:hypothetical protein